MRITRIYQASPLQTGNTLELSSAAANHLTRVLRLPVGTEFIIFNGDGGEYRAVITDISKKTCQITIKEFIDRNPESSLRIHLVQGIAHGDKMDFIIQKAVELGVASVLPLLSQFCDVRKDDARLQKRLQHWRNVAISACEQCGRNQIPPIHEPLSFANWLAQSQQLPQHKTQQQLSIILHPYHAKSLPKLDTTPPEITLIIGPEGGFSEQEVTLAMANGCLPVSLGPRILRTETAALTGISILQHLWGDMA